MLSNALFVGLGGFLGAIARFGINNLGKSYLKDWPVGTLLANLIGTLLMAFLLYGLFSQKTVPEAFRLFVLVGFCGSLTTMSSFAVEVVQLNESHEFGWAILYFLLNIVGCLFAVFLAKYIFFS